MNIKTEVDKKVKLKELKPKQKFCFCGFDISNIEKSTDHVKSCKIMKTLPICFKCSLCNNVYANVELLRRHKREDHTIPCQYCGEVFQIEKLLEQHLQDKHSVYVNRTCGICNKTFANKASLQIHQDMYHKLKCKHCEKVFETRDLMKQHIAEDHRIARHKLPTIKCDICGLPFSGTESYKRHVRRQHSKKCKHCDEVLQTDKLLADHMAKEHSIFNKSPICDICSKAFYSKHSLAMHYEKIHNYNLKCMQCDKEFLSKPLLKQHLKNDHLTFEIYELNVSREASYKTNMVQWIKCNHCDKFCRSQKLVDQHILEKHGQDKVFKPEIDIGSSSNMEKDAVPGGSAARGDEFIYKCHECTEVFESFHELEYHGKMHIKSLEIKQSTAGTVSIASIETNRCDVCNVKFESMEELEKHSKVHIKVEEAL